VRSALKGGKALHSIEYLGCTIDEFKRHIEGTFQHGMSWDNHGAIRVDGPRVWNIDHCTPIKYPGVDGSPPTLEEVAARLHWTNTKAMWADENITKGNRFVDTVDQQEQQDDAFTELFAGLEI